MRSQNYSADKEIEEIIAVFKDRPESPHLASRLGVSRYIKVADHIVRLFPRGKILDWGTGCGQMTYLLKNRGLDVVSYEIAASERPLLEKIGQPVVIGEDPVKLPFPDGSFDAVLSSGVLEHVQNDRASLIEVNRVLKRGGYFFVYMLPNKFSLIEYLSDRLGRGDHPVKYTVRGIKQMLGLNGFAVLEQGYQNFLPYNLKGFPAIVGRVYHLLDVLWEKLDAFFTRWPLGRQISTNLWVIAQKR